ncbi:hypothetical protein SAMN02745883_01845 [Caminicella sporogenes DSM 14501]|uniref:Uncharacterized protein n=1 Tax=Caminicella sporogenes DSM 14501 TaxID=1121266 RepID=A0A1M6RQ30_9FIRM|nr:hypothetical protein [Caminicella sporogenes]RKD23680.1 hypothetical protein BET04_04600 [Caminicella sporogenes]SHK34576.1 hypothetical protein SAMN02745883_01845 [Caminicella sporogenes DSM 14501]
MHTIECLTAYFIEGFFMAGAGLSLLGIKLKIKKLMHIAFIYSFFVFIVRKIYITFKIHLGTHAFILMFILGILIKLIGKQNFLTGIIASLTSFLLLLWGEGIFLFPILKCFKIDPITLMSLKFGGTIIAILISDILLIVGFLIGYIFNITLVDFKSLKNTE